jgi:hypothetical protein
MHTLIGMIQSWANPSYEADIAHSVSSNFPISDFLLGISKSREEHLTFFRVEGIAVNVSEICRFSFNCRDRDCQMELDLGSNDILSNHLREIFERWLNFAENRGAN